MCATIQLSMISYSLLLNVERVFVSKTYYWPFFMKLKKSNVEQFFFLFIMKFTFVFLPICAQFPSLQLKPLSFSMQVSKFWHLRIDQTPHKTHLQLLWHVLKKAEDSIFTWEARTAKSTSSSCESTSESTRNSTA